MTESVRNSGLSAQAREFVAVGASVGAGCHPCVAHHVKAGAAAGLEAPALLGAITAAERVTADSSARMAQHARRQLPGSVPGVTAEGTVRDATLAALGAAVAANSMPNIERYLTEAAELGVPHDDLVDAVGVAQEVQANAVRIHARRTGRLVESPPAVAPPAAAEAVAPTQADDECEQTCPCHDEDDTAGGGAVSATDPTPAATAAVPGCADATAGDDQPPRDDRPPSAVAGERGAAGSVMAGWAPSPAMLSACCVGVPA